MGQEEREVRLRQKIDKATSEKDIVSILAELCPVSDGSKEQLRTDGLLGKMAFEALKDHTSEDYAKGRALIIDYLIPLCIQDSDNTDVRFNLKTFRECLTNWIYQYHGSQLEQMRNAVLDRLLQSFEGQSLKGVFFTLTSIGFRRRDVVETLWKKIEEDNNEIGDAALSALGFLGIADDDRKRVLEETHTRMNLRYNISLSNILRILADRKSVDPILTYWILPRKVPEGGSHLHMTVQILADIADSKPDNAELQDTVWNAILTALDTYSSDTDPMFVLSLGSSIAPKCDTPNVVNYFLGALGNDSVDKKQAGYRHYLIQERLRDCVRPRQQNGWDSGKYSDIVEILKRYACFDTKERGRFTTTLMRYKESAWKTLFCLGWTDAFEEIDTALAHETNGFLRNTICEYIACFRLDQIPLSIDAWITEECDSNKEEIAKWIFRYGALDIALGSSSMQAFEAVLNCGLTIGGQTPKKTIDALSGIAVALSNSGNDSIYRKLIEKLKYAKKTYQQDAAACALEAIAKHGFLIDEPISDLEECLLKETRGKHQRAVIASVFGFLKRESLTDRIWNSIKGLSMDEDEWIASHALEVLARHDRLRDHEELLVSKLGLKRIHQNWDIEEDMGSMKWSAYFTAWLQFVHHEEFTPAITTIFSKYPWASVAQVLGFWETRAGRSLKISREIEDALIKRTIKRQTASYSEKDLFHYLAIFIPDKLAQTNWEEVWDEWIPEARQALAEALGEAQYDSVFGKSRALKLLIELAEDGIFAVRRSAYRSMSRKSPEGLCAWTSSVSKTDSPIESRKRAAEACGWIPEDTFGDEYERLYIMLRTDPEMHVREAMAKAHLDRRNRGWANSYLKKVLSVTGSSNEEILNTWRYGEALTELGDDTCLQELSKKLQEPQLPPNLAFWLYKISKELEKNWQKKIRDWPDPWITYKGRVDEGRGDLLYPDGKETEVHYTIWHKAASGPRNFDEWNGTAFPIEEKFFFDPGTQELELRLKSGSSGRILVTSNHFKWIVFVNQGRFPHA